MKFKTTTITMLMCIPVIVCLILCAVNVKSVDGDSQTLPFAVSHKYTEEHMIKYTGFGVDLYIYDSGVKDDGTHLTFKSYYEMDVPNLVVSCAVGEVFMVLAVVLVHLSTVMIMTLKNKRKEQTEESNQTELKGEA